MEEQPKKTGSEIRHEPPNVKTNPPRKGSYGYKGVTLSERVGTVRALLVPLSLLLDPSFFK